MKRKGISPLIAAVLLIAFTMAVAAILTAWVTTFTQDTTGSVGNESERLVSCSFAGVSIYDAVHDTSNDEVTVAVANTGTRDLNDGTNVILSYANGSVQQTNIASLSSGDVSSVTFSLLGNPSTSDLSEVRAASQGCPEVTDDEEDFVTN